METTDQPLVSSWFGLGLLPESYVFPPEKRPGKVNCRRGNTIPIVDLSLDRTHTIQKIMGACQEFGFFQAINHGVCEELLNATMDVIEEFNAMPEKEKVLESSRDPNKSCRLYTSSGRFKAEEIHCWRDALMHNPCYPLDKYIRFWPQNPNKYRDVVGTYLTEVRRLSDRILDMICEGLGLELGFLGGNLSENPMMLVNHYPPCPDPTLTLGLTKHYDPSVVTIVLQGDVSGLQVFKDQEWINVEPIAHALVVNVGHVLQIISNGKLKSAEHRVVTNSIRARTTASFFVNPSEDAIIEPAKTLVDICNKKPLCRAVEYGVFKEVYLSTSADAEAVKELMSPMN